MRTDLLEILRAFSTEFPDPELFLAQLVIEGVLNDDEWELARKQDGKAGRIAKLLAILSSKPSEDFDKLLRVFISRGLTNLVVKIDARLEKDGIQPEVSISPTEELIQEIASNLKRYYKQDAEAMCDEWQPLMGLGLAVFSMDTSLHLEILDEGPRQGRLVQDIKDVFGGRLEEFGARIVLEGDPGVGKTTFVHKIAFDWANGHEFLQQRFDIVLRFRLGDCKAPTTLECLCGTLLDDFSRTNEFLELLKVRPKLQERVLLIFDAFDEFLFLKESVEVWRILNRQLLRDLTVLTATRFSHSDKIQVKTRRLNCLNLPVELNM